MAPACTYRYESPVIKALERRLDGFLEPLDPGHPHYFVEVQGYDDPSIYWRAVGQMGIYHEQRPQLNGKEWQIIIFFLDKRYDPGPQTLGPLYPGHKPWLIRGELPTLLTELPNPSPVLNVLRPLTAQDVQVIQSEGATWVEAIRNDPTVDAPTEAKLITLLVQFVAQRFIHLPRKEIDRMLKLTPFEETVAGKEYIQEGLQQGIQQGIQQGLQQGLQQAIREDIVAILDERLGRVPAQIAERIQAISDLALLRKLLRQAATIDAFDDFLQILDRHTTTA